MFARRAVCGMDSFGFRIGVGDWGGEVPLFVVVHHLKSRVGNVVGFFCSSVICMCVTSSYNTFIWSWLQHTIA